MEQDRFDDLAKKVFSGSSRRRVIGGALASALGVGVAAVTGADAKNKKAKAQGKNKKGRAKGEFTCTAANANVPALGGCASPTACCSSTPAGNGPACVEAAVQTGSQTCGDPALAGAGVCRTCPTGTRCSGAPLFRCVCDPTTCEGCCIDNAAIGENDQCIANGSGAPVNSPNPDYDGSFVCGTGGSICNVCSVGTLFAGCCTASGACSAGTSNANCGSNGELCETCQNDSECGIDQACTGGTTTTTPAPTTAPPCGFTKGGNPKVTCGTACCGPKRGCNGDGTKCGKKKKK
jgi:hypothetical protein